MSKKRRRYAAIAKPKADATAEWQSDPLKAAYNKFSPLPTQAQAMEFVTDEYHKEILFGGAYGGSKSYWLCFSMLYLCLKYPGYQIMVGRFSRTDLNKTIWIPLLMMAENVQEMYGLKYEVRGSDSTDRTLTFMTGSTTATRSSIRGVEMKNPDNFQGANLDCVAIDEAAQCSSRTFQEVRARLRGSDYNPRTPDPEEEGRFVPQWPVKLLLTANPAPGIVNEEFAKPFVRGELKPGNERRRVFVPSKTKDNLYVDREYIENLVRSYTPEQRRRYLEGEWVFAEGAVFPEINPDVWQEVRREYITQEPYDFTQTLIGYDYGHTHPCGILKGFIYNETLYIEEELNESKVPLDQQAEWMLEERGAMVFADRSVVWQQHSVHQRSVKVADYFQELGLSVIPANEGVLKAIVPHISLMRQAFKMAKIVIDPDRCPKLRQALEDWVYFQHPNGDYADDKFSETGKDIIDALRYLFINVTHLLNLGTGGELDGAQDGVQSADGGYLTSKPVFSERELENPAVQRLARKLEAQENPWLEVVSPGGGWY